MHRRPSLEGPALDPAGDVADLTSKQSSHVDQIRALAYDIEALRLQPDTKSPSSGSLTALQPKPSAPKEDITLKEASDRLEEYDETVSLGEHDEEFDLDEGARHVSPTIETKTHRILAVADL